MGQEDRSLGALQHGLRLLGAPFLSPLERRRPAHIRSALIGTLFGRTSNVAMLAVAALVCGWLADQRGAWMPSVAIAGAEVLAITTRCGVILAYKRGERLGRPRDPEAWLAAFGWLALVSSLLWGALCFVSFAEAHDPVLFSIPVLSTVGIAGSIAARNSAVPRLAKAQLALSLAPILAGCLMAGDHGFRTLLVLVPAMAIGLVILINERNEQLVKLMEVQQELDHLARTDALTGIANRRTFDKAIQERTNSGRAFSLLLIDVDHFKRFNDIHGHPAGDAMLRRLAQNLSSDLRNESDLIARYGGEEFAVLLEGVDADGAWATAERLREHVMRGVSSAVGPRITISVGVSSSGPERNIDEIVQRADDALYRAKRTGRNTVVCWEPPLPARNAVLVG